MLKRLGSRAWLLQSKRQLTTNSPWMRLHNNYSKYAYRYGWIPNLNVTAPNIYRTSRRKMSSFSGFSTPLLNQVDAQDLDVELMTQPGFSIDQLMELAGLSVACAVAAAYAPGSRVLAIAGPGNNGGDALVAARHLIHFGYMVEVLYPKRPNKQLFTNLIAQLKSLEVPFLDSFPGNVNDKFDVILDGIFGFSFNSQAGIRAPFDTILDDMIDASIPVASIDIPSGWNVEKGPKKPDGSVLDRHLRPDMLISLTAPKMCAKFFEGNHHFLGGRFLPPKLGAKYGLEGLPKYPGTSQIVRLPSTCKDDAQGSL